MSEVKVTLKDGSVKEFAAGTSYLEIAKSLNQKLGKQALLAVVDGVNKDLSDTIEKDAAVEFVTPDTKEGLHAIRHTASHVMAQAIQHLFPGVKLAIGPPSTRASITISTVSTSSRRKIWVPLKKKWQKL